MIITITITITDVLMIRRNLFDYSSHNWGHRHIPPDALQSRREVMQQTKYGRLRSRWGLIKGWNWLSFPAWGQPQRTPHLINYRANILALYKLGVRNILATAAVGSLNYDFKPGHFVLVDQFLDFTKSRCSTFYEGGEAGVALRYDCLLPPPEAAIVEASQNLQYEVSNGGYMYAPKARVLRPQRRFRCISC